MATHCITPASYPRIPESDLPNPHSDISVILSKAKAVLSLLQASGMDMRTGFTIDHATVMDSLWCLEGLIEEAELQTRKQRGDEAWLQ